MIEKISHYSIPKSCPSTGTSCPLPALDLSQYMPKVWESRYTELKLSETEHLLREDITGLYTPQGACTDGTYLYRALVASDESATWIQKISLETGDIVAESKAESYGHANDMTYRDGSLYIAHSSSTSTVYKINATTFALETIYNLPLTIWGIAYDPVNDLFVIGGVGSAFFSVYYPDFSFMYRIKPQNPFYGMVRQGIHADSNYIYVSLDNAYGAVTGNEAGSRVMVYTWNGIFVKSIYIPIAEIEWCFEHGGKLYVGTYEGRDVNDVKSGKIYAVPFDMYPGQTVITGRPTDVSGGINNMQRLPEGTPVRLWVGTVGLTNDETIHLTAYEHGLHVDENGPFRYLRFRFKGANQQVFDWYPQNNGVVCLREVDVTAAQNDSNMRVREMRLTFNVDAQTFQVESNHADEFKWDGLEKFLSVKKYTDNTEIELINLYQIWGVV